MIERMQEHADTDPLPHHHSSSSTAKKQVYKPSAASKRQFVDSDSSFARATAADISDALTYNNCSDIDADEQVSDDDGAAEQSDSDETRSDVSESTLKNSSPSPQTPTTFSLTESTPGGKKAIHDIVAMYDHANFDYSFKSGTGLAIDTKSSPANPRRTTARFSILGRTNSKLVPPQDAPSSPLPASPLNQFERPASMLGPRMPRTSVLSSLRGSGSAFPPPPNGGNNNITVYSVQSIQMAHPSMHVPTGPRRSSDTTSSSSRPLSYMPEPATQIKIGALSTTRAPRSSSIMAPTAFKLSVLSPEVFSKPPSKVVKAMRGYTRQMDLELTFVVGDFFYVVEESHPSHFEVINPLTMAHGFAPRDCFGFVEKKPRPGSMLMPSQHLQHQHQPPAFSPSNPSSDTKKSYRASVLVDARGMNYINHDNNNNNNTPGYKKASLPQAPVTINTAQRASVLTASTTTSSTASTLVSAHLPPAPSPPSKMPRSFLQNNMVAAAPAAEPGVSHHHVAATPRADPVLQQLALLPPPPQAVIIRGCVQISDCSFLKVNVKQADGKRATLLRSVADFGVLHVGLIQQFPLESGRVRRNAPRRIPFLPDGMLEQVKEPTRNGFGKVEWIRCMKGLEVYLRVLIKGPVNVAGSAIVGKFFEPRADDLIANDVEAWDQESGEDVDGTRIISDGYVRIGVVVSKPLGRRLVAFQISRDVKYQELVAVIRERCGLMGEMSGLGYEDEEGDIVPFVGDADLQLVMQSKRDNIPLHAL
ncbi:hypothetical protein BJ741DRAFT_652239 [Chytriomyces cf. hyalinus JEL632]|nr:hypothetical protein BJ741DRAFT_652239 [Chytriomyces cf. hyalinus JEL632]